MKLVFFSTFGLYFFIFIIFIFLSLNRKFTFTVKPEICDSYKTSNLLDLSSSSNSLGLHFRWIHNKKSGCFSQQSWFSLQPLWRDQLCVMNILPRLAELIFFSSSLWEPSWRRTNRFVKPMNLSSGISLNISCVQNICFSIAADSYLHICRKAFLPNWNIINKYPNCKISFYAFISCISCEFMQVWLLLAFFRKILNIRI